MKESEFLKFTTTEGSPKEVLLLGLRDGKLFVEGDLDEGAKLFFDEIIKPMADKYIEEQLSLTPL